MDSWLKQAALEVAKVAAEAAEGAAHFGNDIAEQALLHPARRDIEFAAGPLGLKLEGPLVAAVDEKGQAGKLGVLPGDILAAVDGFEVPAVPVGDSEEEQRRDKLIKKWIKEAPRPVRLTFQSLRFQPVDAEVPPAGLDAVQDAEAEWQSLMEEQPESGFGIEPHGMPDARGSREASDAYAPEEASRPAGELDQADTDFCDGDLSTGASQGQLRSLHTELRQEQAQRIWLCRELVQARHARSSMSEELEGERRLHSDSREKVTELQQRLAALNDECRELRRVTNHGVEDDRIFRETSEAREHVLEDEVARLRSELVAADGKKRAEVEAVSQKVHELEETVATQASELHKLLARAVEAENKVGTAEWDLRKVRETRVAEQAEERGQHERDIATLNQQLSDARQRCSDTDEELRETRSHLERLQQAATGVPSSRAVLPHVHKLSDGSSIGDEQEEGVDVDADAAATELESPSRPTKVSLEAEAAQDRIDFLEQRCRSLQHQLNARPIVFQKPINPAKLEEGGSVSGQALSWEPQLRSMAGPYTAAFVVRFYNYSDQSLRNFTQRLLKNDAMLWVFYAHLAILYMILASSFAHLRHASSDVEMVSLVHGSGSH